MRFRGLLLASMLAFPALPAHAETVIASHHGLVVPEDGRVTVVTVCAGRADRTTATVTVVCTVDDSGPDAALTQTCESPGSYAACGPLTLPDGVLPVTICAEAVATFSDETTATDEDCDTYVNP